jgi:6-phosphogluconolactonase
MQRTMMGLCALFLLSTVTARADDHPRHPRRPATVYTITNEADANRVLAFEVHQGRLGEPVAYATQGRGSGDSLGSQGALVLSDDRRFLLAVNAGSNELSVFAVGGGTRLELRERVRTGRTRPISVTERSGLVYVVHAGSSDVTGFHLDERGRLDAIAGSHRALSRDNAGPAQLELTRDARTLVVTEKTSNVISSFAVDAYGKLSPARANASAGVTPFGFELTSRDLLVVSEAASGSMSSYRSGPEGLSVVSAAVSDTQKAPCWVAITPDDRVAFTANAGSASISSYTISSSGSLCLQDARAGELGEGGTPLDLALARGGSYLFALDRGHARIASFALAGDGALQPIGTSAGELPAFTTGLVAN